MENNVLFLAALCMGAASLLALRESAGERRKSYWLPVWGLSAGLLLVASGLLLLHLLNGSFQYQYVFEHTNLALPTAYRISAMWAGQEGSFLLWATLLSLTGFAAMRLPGSVRSLYGAVSCVIAVMCFLSNPFRLLQSVPADGAGLNGALQDPWMVVHPPLVFIGYSAMAVLFAFSIFQKKSESEKYHGAFRVWILVSFLFLGLGIFTGSIWAYRALGWGGYWAWDPIENSALVPWLLLCAFLHDNKVITLPRSMIPFFLACAGTFLTRSGLLQNLSVHSYGKGALAIVVLLPAVLCVSALLLLRKHGKTTPLKIKNSLKAIDRGPKALFQIVTYIYAGLILLGTWLPVAAGRTAPTGYFNGISAAYALLYAGFLCVYEGRQAGKRMIAAMALSCVLTFVALLRFSNASFGGLILFWVSLLPLLLLFTRPKRLLKSYSLLHAGATLMILGIVASSLFGGGGLLIGEKNTNSIDVLGTHIEASKFEQKKSVILTKPFVDYVLDTERMEAAGDSVLIPYTEKPLINLFWAGGFVVFGASARLIIRSRFTE